MNRPARLARLTALSVGLACIMASSAAQGENQQAVGSVMALKQGPGPGGERGGAAFPVSGDHGEAGSVTFGRALEIEGNPVRLSNKSGLGRPSGKGFVSAYNGPFAKPAGLPLRASRISSRYGSRRHPILGSVRFHQGLDFPANMGAPVFATAPGMIAAADWCGSLGYCIVIDHGKGYSSVFGHLMAISVEQGQIVQRGQKLGSVGSTGISTGPHLHFEIRLNGMSLDPLPYL